ncbi:MAG TPA: hypothetical protein VFZ73_12235 [Gemmatimonadaceae bacterium]
MRKVCSLTIGAALLAACETNAVAQFPGMGGTRPISLVVSGGMTLPAADLGDLHDAGFHYDASLIFTIPGFPIALRPEFSLTQFKLKDPVLATPDADDVTNMMAFMGNIEVPLGAGLYVLAGGGILSLTVPQAATGTQEENSKKFVFDAGAGLRFALGGIRGFVEARIGAASYDEGKLGFSKAQFIPVTFGLVF